MIFHSQSPQIIINVFEYAHKSMLLYWRKWLRHIRVLHSCWSRALDSSSPWLDFVTTCMLHTYCIHSNRAHTPYNILNTHPAHIVFIWLSSFACTHSWKCSDFHYTNYGYLVEIRLSMGKMQQKIRDELCEEECTVDVVALSFSVPFPLASTIQA